MIPNDYEVTLESKFWKQNVQLLFKKGRVCVSVHFKPRLRYERICWEFFGLGGDNLHVMRNRRFGPPDNVFFII